MILGVSDENKIKVKASFVFPKMKNIEQNIFVNEDCTKLIEFCDDEAHIYNILPKSDR